MRPWRRMTSAIFARSGGPPAASLITWAASRKYCGPIAAGVITQSAFESWIPLFDDLGNQGLRIGQSCPNFDTPGYPWGPTPKIMRKLPGNRIFQSNGFLIVQSFCGFREIWLQIIHSSVTVTHRPPATVTSSSFPSSSLRDGGLIRLGWNRYLTARASLPYVLRKGDWNEY